VAAQIRAFCLAERLFGGLIIRQIGGHTPRSRNLPGANEGRGRCFLAILL